MVGQTLGHYKVLEKLGAGGMGEVYLAEDTTLRRQVALKVLPPELASDQERIERFQREAETLAALDHPNIVTVYSVEHDQDVHFLTMQLVEGKPLSQLIHKGGMPLEEIFEIAIPLADGLATAHEKGVIHRDLKPANVMVSDEGRVKVLDFGLAKLRQETEASLATELPTEPLTEEGKIVGTMPYMSPEQLEGRDLDARSDIFSLGVVLYEMATGERPFTGDTAVSLIMAIGRDTPPEVDTLRKELPHHLSRVVSHCLVKRPERRYQSVKDVRNELEALRKEIGSNVVQLGPPSRRRPWPLIAALAGALIVGIGGFMLWWSLVPGTAGPTASGLEDTVIERKMIVVLPFENLGPTEDDYFAAGMTEEITSRLAAVNGLGVISRTSAVQYERTGKTLNEVGADLGVEFVLEGTVRWSRPQATSSRVLVTPQLIRVADDTYLWSERYDQELDDLFAVQALIARQVVSMLEVTLLDSERRLLEARPTENMEAHQAFLRGMESTRRPGGINSQEWGTAVEMFERAVDLDPGFALAYARLGWALSGAAWTAEEGFTERPWPPARRAAKRALELWPGLPEAHLALAEIHYRAERDYEQALKQLALAAAGRPSDSEITSLQGAIYRRQGDWEQAVVAFEAAALMDPRSSAVALGLASTLSALRRYPEADDAYARSISLGPDQAEAHLFRWLNRVSWNGDLRASRAILHQSPATLPILSDCYWYAQLWLEREFDKLLEEISKPGAVVQEQCTPFTYFRLFEAVARMKLGDAEGARDAYDRTRDVMEGALAGKPAYSASPGDLADSGRRGILAEAYAGLGRTEEGIRVAEQAAEHPLVSLDALHRPVFQEHLAYVCVLAGEYEKALGLLHQVLSVPSHLSVPRLQLDPSWDPLRDHPRFQALLEKYGQEPG